jgi:hypothetical protein
VKFHLQNLRLDTGISKNIEEERTLAVTVTCISLEAYGEISQIPDSDIPHDTEIYQPFHRRPSLLHRRVLEINTFSIRAEPFRGISFRGVNIFQSNRKMNQEKIKVCPTT